MAKKSLVILLTVLIVVSTAILSVATVFRVRAVDVKAAVISSLAEEEAEELKIRLLEEYKNDSTFSVNDKKAKAVIEEFPYFRITGFEKVFPDRLVIHVSEDAECYAVEKKDTSEYYIVNSEGLVLSIRDSALNRLDQYPNIIISGDGLSVSGEKGQKLLGGETWETLLAFCNDMAKDLNGLRDNVVSITVSKYAPEYCISMREGVRIYVGTPGEMTAEKAKAAVEKYLSLTDAQRMKGKIMIGAKDGNLIVSYDEKDFNA